MTDVHTEAVAQTPKRTRRGRKRQSGVGLLLAIALIVMALAVGVIGMAMTGRTLGLPVWAVAQIEDRLNRGLGGSHLSEGAALSVGEIDLALDGDFTPRFRLRDLRLMDPTGKAILVLPEIAVAIDPGAALAGRLRPSSVRLLGAHLAARRDVDGRIALSVGGMSGSRAPQSLAEVLDALDRMFSTPALADLAVVEADALTLTLVDDRAGRVWELGDGRLVIENRAGALAADLSLTLLDGVTPARAQLTIESDKATSGARILAKLDGMAAADLAAQAPPLAVLGLLDAPISGRMLGELGPDGVLKGFEAVLSLGAGGVKPAPDAAALPFEKAELALRYDPARQRITLGSLRLESPSLRLKARGSAELQDGRGGMSEPGDVPVAVVGQLTFSELMVDPEGLFSEPVRFDTGALSVRVTLDPFRAEIGQLVMGEGEEQLRLEGEVSAGEGGWSGSLAVALDRIDADRLVKLWPVSVVPKTREWLAANVGQAQFLGFDAGLRFAPGQESRFALDYDFAEAEVRFIRTLPPVKEGRGRATIFGNAYTVVLEGGHVTAPDGGRIDATGSVFKVPDISVFPAYAEVRLATVSDLTAALSLLDQEPFRFLTKAGRPIDLGQGQAKLVSDLRFPLKDKIGVDDVTYAVSGRVSDFRSTVLVPGRVLTLPDMAVQVTSEGLDLAGKGQLDGLSFDARFRQAFDPAGGGQGELTADVRLTDKALRGFGIGLPAGWLSGETVAQVAMSIPKAGPLKMDLTSSLIGAGVKIGPIGWSKAAKTKAALAITATLGPQPKIDSLRLTAPGLKAEGSLNTTKGGALQEMRLTSLQVGDWLDASVRLTGKGKGRVAVEVLDGSLDLRRMPTGGGSDGNGATEVEVALDQLIVSAGITLTAFRGAFVSRNGGLDGRFKAAVNGRGAIDGTVVPDRGRTAVRITSANAGTVMAAAGVFANGRGGSLELTLTPRGPEGQYIGIAAFSDLSVQDAPVLAALLSAVSVVGLLEQMAGGGLVFDEGDVEFVLNASGVQITRGTAVGLSLGISFEGAYSSASGRLDLQGVISPIYILNSLGQIFARKGEGLFGFNYTLTGKADNPTVSVNPLSILTPGMFREIFRRPPPQIEGNG